MLAALGLALTACNTTPIHILSATPSPSPTPAVAIASATPVPPTPTPIPPAPSPTPTACAPLAAIATWPLAQRAAQLVVAPAFGGQVAGLGASISQGIGGVLLLDSAPGDLRRQVAAAQGMSHVPLLVMADQEGGGIQRLGSLVLSLPWPRAMAQTMTPAAVANAAATLGAQMKALGVGVDLAPVLDVDGGAGPTATDVIGSRSFGADPQVATSYGLAFANGLRRGGEVAVVKHFPGLGGATGNTELGASTTLPWSTLQQAGLLPFQAAIRDGLPAVMVSHATVPGLTSGPASLSAAAITGVLRQRLGFHGLVMTDSLTAGAVSTAGYTPPSAAVAAVQAGADMLLFGSTLTQLPTPATVAAAVHGMVDALVGAVKAGRLPPSRLDEAVLHVLQAKGVDPCAG